MVFPGEQDETWSYDRTAKAWFYHRFYKFQPDLNMANPAVREEIKKIVAFWLQLGVAGFRIDAVPFIIELTEAGNPDTPKDLEFLTELRQHAQWRRATPSCSPRPTSSPRSSSSTSPTPAAPTTASTCSSTSCSTAG